MILYCYNNYFLRTKKKSSHFAHDLEYEEVLLSSRKKESRWVLMLRNLLSNSNHLIFGPKEVVYFFLNHSIYIYTH